ncbi:MAG: shikimate kinase [Candidatus Omnitrophica bacterium]|nr:shikimate kinase [Candidatus Omnitrophota bacterium]
MPNIYLVGMMGSGKSVTGKQLARLLRTNFVDLDDYIEKKNCASIAEIFEKKGESFFRDEETSVLKEVSQKENQVIATGGGLVLKSEHRILMHENGTVVYLETTLPTLIDRLRGKKDRPLLKGGKFEEMVARIFLERKSLYEKVCDFSVTTDGETAESVAKKIFEVLEKTRS